MEQGLKYIMFYVQKPIAPLTMCYNLLLVRNKPLGAPAFVKLVYSHFSHWECILQLTDGKTDRQMDEQAYRYSAFLAH